MTLVRYLASIFAPTSTEQARQVAKARKATKDLHQRVDELSAQSKQLADWWTEDAKANHYAQRIRAAYRAEATGNQARIEEQ